MSKTNDPSPSFEEIKNNYIKYRDLYFNGIQQQLSQLFGKRIVKQRGKFITQKQIQQMINANGLLVDVDLEIIIDQFNVKFNCVFIKNGINRGEVLRNVFFGVGFEDEKDQKDDSDDSDSQNERNERNEKKKKQTKKVKPIKPIKPIEPIEQTGPDRQDLETIDLSDD